MGAAWYVMNIKINLSLLQRAEMGSELWPFSLSLWSHFHPEPLYNRAFCLWVGMVLSLCLSLTCVIVTCVNSHERELLWYPNVSLHFLDVDVISRFAQLEFHSGDTEHAKALFESTLSSYPKRTDIWSIYMDIMIKHGSQKEVRWVVVQQAGMGQSIPEKTRRTLQCEVV